jgi:hypothetical protein
VLNVSVLHDDPTINDLLGWIIALFVQVTVFGGLIAAVIGAFLVTAPDPRQRERESPASARNAARLAAVSTIVLFAASTATGLIRSGGPWQMAHQVLMIAAFAALALTILGLLRVFESLAARTFDAALPGQVAARYRRLRWLLPAMIGGMLLMELGSGRGGSFGTILDAIVAFGSCAVVVFWIMLLLEVLRFVSLMVSLRRALRHCLENAANDVR